MGGAKNVMYDGSGNYGRCTESGGRIEDVPCDGGVYMTLFIPTVRIAYRTVTCCVSFLESVTSRQNMVSLTVTSRTLMMGYRHDLLLCGSVLVMSISDV